MTEEEQHRSLHNCERLRRFRMRSLQIRPDPQYADNIHLRVGRGQWQLMHIIDALAFVKASMRQQRINAIRTRAAITGTGAPPPLPRR